MYIPRVYTHIFIHACCISVALYLGFCGELLGFQKGWIRVAYRGLINNYNGVSGPSIL